MTSSASDTPRCRHTTAHAPRSAFATSCSRLLSEAVKEQPIKPSKGNPRGVCHHGPRTSLAPVTRGQRPTRGRLTTARLPLEDGQRLASPKAPNAPRNWPCCARSRSTPRRATCCAARSPSTTSRWPLRRLLECPPIHDGTGTPRRPALEGRIHGGTAQGARDPCPPTDGVRRLRPLPRLPRLGGRFRGPSPSEERAPR